MDDETVPPADPFRLQRFIDAQAGSYAQALAELRAGHKRSHWMWYIFPQLAGLGQSATSRRYAIDSRAEAHAYLAHPVLGPRLLACADTLLALEGPSASDIFGYPDTLKFRSSLTLFAAVSEEGSVFERLLAKYFGGEPDSRTLQLLEALPA